MFAFLPKNVHEPRRYIYHMEEWLHIPATRKGIPVWRLCLLMAVTFLILWIGSPLFFGA